MSLEQAQQLFFAALEAQSAGKLADAEKQYREALALAPGRPSILNNLSSVLCLQKRHAEALTLAQTWVAAESKNALAWLLLGNTQWGVGDAYEAMSSYDRALALDDSLPEAHSNRGLMLAEMGQPDEALEAQNRALALRPDFVDALINRGNLFIDRSEPDAALADYDRALALAPDNANAHSCRANALMDLGRAAEALESSQKALALDPANEGAMLNRGNALKALRRYAEAVDAFEQSAQMRKSNAEAIWNLSLLQLTLGDFGKGWQNYRSRWLTPQSGAKRPPLTQPEWDGRVLDGTLLLWGEQGVGDQILYASQIARIARFVDHLVVAVDARLVPLMQRSFPTVEFVGPAQLANLRCDRQIAMGDAAGLMIPDWDSFPKNQAHYLVADKTRQDALRARLSAHGGPLIGVSWRSTNPRIGRFKTIQLPDLEAVLRPAGTVGVDLQYGDTAADHAALRTSAGLTLHRESSVDNFQDIDGLAALIAACDVIVTASNTTAHIAGALGKRCHVLLPDVPGSLWYWHEGRTDSPWYPSVTLWRRKSGENWRDLAQRVAGTLSD
jgi:tetratricopeptide (TPR) repeat protein